jgi:Flp pilus assembly protein TadG
VNLLPRRTNKKSERAQTFVLLAAVLAVLIVFVGLAIDLGLAYVAKTTLAKAVDAATLAAMRNVNNQSMATTIATSAFNANYQSVPGLGVTPVPQVTFFTCTNGNTCVQVSATATINTYFLRVLGSNYDTLNVSDSAIAQRKPLVMSLVLDKSGSMNFNGGAQALPSAVTNFISYFDQAIDSVAEISFSSIDTVDVRMTTEFVSPITNAVQAMSFQGATFAQAGLNDGKLQIEGIPQSPNIIRVAVFFTDGWANTNNDNLDCQGNGNLTNLNYGGCSLVENQAGWCTGVFWMDPTSGTVLDPSACSATTFPVHVPGGGNALTPPNPTGENNVSNDASYRTAQLAATMRSTDQVTIYTIGLGNKINTTYLQEIANDPAADTYDPSQPSGEAIFAPDATQLEEVFQTIASRILLRLSQ